MVSEFRLRDPSDVAVLVRLWAELVAAEFNASPDATGNVACVTIVRAAPEADSIRLSVNIPSAATSPVVVCANLLIENEPVTCGTEAASRAVVITVVGADVVADSAEVVVGDSKGVAVVDVVAVVDADVVG